ncbi:MAG: sugar phosphate isomerase/epimerase family protein [Acidimicrobiales bacterium]
MSGICTMSWDLDRDLAYWSEAGIRRVGIPYAKLEAAGWDTSARLVASEGLLVNNVIGAGFALDDPSRWPAQTDRLLAAVRASGTVGAECLVLTTGPAGRLGWDEAAFALAEALAPVCAAARKAGVPIALEHTNSLRIDVGFLHTLRDALDLADQLGLGVCMEINACWAERDLAGSIARGSRLLRLVQVSDYLVPTLRTPDRCVVGDGHIPIRDILGRVLASGYQGAFDLELVGPRIEEEGYASAIGRSVRSLTDILADLGA